jgi:CDP-diacylglycerol---glycerol-3-phosphate 3-phosphatidyltransferase
MTVTPNQLTAIRFILAVVCPVLLIWNRSIAVEIVTLLLFTIACVTDWLDGYLARKLSLVSKLGKIIDPIADKLLILGIMFVFALFSLYSVELVIVILVREVVVTITRVMRLVKGDVLPAEWAGKIKVGFQITSVYFTFVYLFLTDLELSGKIGSTLLAVSQRAHYLGIYLAVFLTVASGIHFFYRLDQS